MTTSPRQSETVPTNDYERGYLQCREDAAKVCDLCARYNVAPWVDNWEAEECAKAIRALEPNPLEVDFDMDIECADLCIHGKSSDVICVECWPENDDGSFTGDEWSEG